MSNSKVDHRKRERAVVIKLAKVQNMPQKFAVPLHESLENYFITF